MSQPNRLLGLLCLVVVTFGTCLVTGFVATPSSWSCRQQQLQQQQRHQRQQRRTSFLSTTMAVEEVQINGDATDASTAMTMSSSSSNSKMGSNNNNNNNNNKSLKKLKNNKVLEDPETMRVPITIRYSADSGLKPYFLTCSKKIRTTYPDVLLEKEVIPAAEDNAEDGQFEIIVDGKTVVGKQKHARNKERYGSGRGDMSVFVSMQEVDLAIKRARNRRRRAANSTASPTSASSSLSSSPSPTVFGEQSSNLRLEQLYNKRNNGSNGSPTNNNNKRQGGNKA